MKKYGYYFMTANLLYPSIKILFVTITSLWIYKLFMLTVDFIFD